MPAFSIIIPAYNNSRYLPECVHSITEQDFRDIEVIIVDDASTDDTYETIKALAREDSRIIPLRHANNSGTLQSRKTGVLASCGSYILPVDQDDELAPGTLTALYDVVRQHPSDVYHYGVQVEASNPAAAQAAAGMTGFLTPTPRTLHGTDILRFQFAEHDNFDWHIHHKLYAADVIKRAYSLAVDQRLLVSDDFYMCFLIDALSSTYLAIPDSSWYIYHLGRGDTFGRALTVRKLGDFARWDADALHYIQQFIHEQCSVIRRDDWNDRLGDARNRLIEHTMNEWKDNLPTVEQPAGLDTILDHWSADSVCGELYRYVRDYAYAYYVSEHRNSEQSLSDLQQAKYYLDFAQRIEHDHGDTLNAGNTHYQQLKAIAIQHLRDAGILAPIPAARPRRNPLRQLRDAVLRVTRHTTD